MKNARRNEYLRHEDDPKPDAPKWCSACCQNLQRRDFYISIGNKDGLQAVCRACITKMNAAALFNTRAIKMGCVGKVTIEERDAIIKIQESRCARCDREVDGNTRCFDHIRPAGMGVLNRPSNLQMLCRACNGRKKQRTQDYRKPEWLAVWPPD